MRRRTPLTGRRGNTFSIDKPLLADCMVGGGEKAATVYPVVRGYDLEDARVKHLNHRRQPRRETPSQTMGYGMFLTTPRLAIEVKLRDETPTASWSRYLPALGCRRGLWLVATPPVRRLRQRDGRDVLFVSAADALWSFP